MHDEEDTNGMIKRCFDNLGISPKQLKLKDAKKEIISLKEKQDYFDLLVDPKISVLLSKRNDANDIVSKIIYEYLYEQRKAFALDFNDLIIFTLAILKSDAVICAKWQHQLQYIMVDEFQDVDRTQFELVKILSNYHKNLFVVGDPDQTIYTWRGAWIGAILDFDLNFPDAKTIVLDINYRSSTKVINASNALIQKNKNRIEKTLFQIEQNKGKFNIFMQKVQKTNQNGSLNRYKHYKRRTFVCRI